MIDTDFDHDDDDDDDDDLWDIPFLSCKMGDV